MIEDLEDQQSHHHFVSVLLYIAAGRKNEDTRCELFAHTNPPDPLS